MEHRISNTFNWLRQFFSYLECDNFRSEDSVANAIIDIYVSIRNGVMPSISKQITLENADLMNSQIKDFIKSFNSTILNINQPLAYLVSEITDNMQQHSNTDVGYVFACFDKATQCIRMVLADGGSSIYGSFVSTNKYLDRIGNSDANAIDLAKEGFSTKDRPEAENRGFGLSFNFYNYIA